MDILVSLIDFILHIDLHLVSIVNDYRYWTYLIMFLILFAETGLVVTPFLPGDSVLFALGALIAKLETDLNLFLMLCVLVTAVVLGDFVNYEFGKYFGARVFNRDSKVFKLSYLKKTQNFYNQHGSKTIIYARFVPIVRTFAPFLAGITKMTYSYFGKYNVVGGFIWVSLFLFTGYFFGQIEFIQKHFSVVVLVIIVISLVPAIVEFLRKR